MRIKHNCALIAWLKILSRLPARLAEWPKVCDTTARGMAIKLASLTDPTRGFSHCNRPRQVLETPARACDDTWRPNWCPCAGQLLIARWEDASERDNPVEGEIRRQNTERLAATRRRNSIRGERRIGLCRSVDVWRAGDGRAGACRQQLVRWGLAGGCC